MFKYIYYVKKFIFTALVATFFLALGATFTSVYTLEMYESSEVGVVYDTSVSNPTEIIYYVKEYNGIIGVYDGSEELMYTVEVYVKTLPAKDRELLKNGIYAGSYGELLEILGDYTA